MGFARLPACAARAGLGSAAKIALVALGAVFLSAAPVDQGHRLVRVQFEWTSDKPECWAGVLETSQGTINDPVSLGPDGWEVGTLWADGKCLWLGRRNPSNRDGFDVTVIASPSAHLSFTLQAPGSGGLRQRFECLLSDLEGESKCLSSKSSAVQVSVRRAPGDALRVVVDRPNLIFRPGETFRATVVPDVLTASPPAAGAKLKWSLCEARTDETLKQGSIPVGKKLAAHHNGEFGLPVEIPLPAKEGAISLRFRLCDEGPSERRSTVQLLVLGEHAPSNGEADRNGEALIDHLTAEDIESKRRLEPSLSRTQASSPNAGTDPSEPAELAPQTDPHVDWIAVRLRLKHPQKAHRLVLHIAPNGCPYCGVSLLEPDARGETLKQTLDTGLVLADSEADDDSRPVDAPALRHEIRFWPQVADPVLMLHDLASGRRPKIASIEVYEVIRAKKHAETSNSTVERLIGPYLAKPLLAENFGGPKVFDPRVGQAIDDWETFHTAALHVADYLVHNGYNSLLIAALSDGTALYPSACLEPTHHSETGALSATQQAPIHRDFLELLYRVFDREGLTLVPELQFSSPLPALERQLVDGPGAEGIELIDANGRSVRERRVSSRERLPDYNPLDPRVQDAVLAAVREVVERYQHHPSFRGVALEVTRTGYLQLPGLEWGYDSATIRRFEHDTGIAVDAGVVGDPFPHRRTVLLGEARAAWVHWRCQELAKFHRRLADTLSTARPNAHLVLACKQMLPDPGADDEIRHEIRTRGRLAEMLAARGIDFSLLGASPRVVVLKSALWRAFANVEESLLDEALSQAASFGSAFRFPRLGVLNYRPPRILRVADFDACSPWQPAQTRLTVTASPTAREGRRRFVRGLAETDAQMIFDGGTMVPLGQEHATADLRQVARAIPSIPFYTVEAGDQSAIVHVARHEKKTYIYAVNPFAQPFALALDLSCPPGTVCRPLGPSPPLVAASAETPGEQTSRLKTSLDGYAVGAWVIDHYDARVTSERTELPAAELARLLARASRFQQQLAIARRVAQFEQSPASNSAGPHSDKGRAIAASREASGEDGSLLLMSGRGSSGALLTDAGPEGESLSADDLQQLAKISLQLTLAADAKRIAECQSLLDSFWCRYLMQRAEPSSRPALIREAAKPPISATR